MISGNAKLVRKSSFRTKWIHQQFHSNKKPTSSISFDTIIQTKVCKTNEQKQKNKLLQFRIQVLSPFNIHPLLSAPTKAAFLSVLYLLSREHHQKRHLSPSTLFSILMNFFFLSCLFITITKIYIGLLISLVDIKIKFFVFALSYKSSQCNLKLGKTSS